MASHASAPRRGTVEVSQGTVNYELWGRGDGRRPLVVTIHGLLGSTQTWAPAAQALARQGYDVLTFDLFGFGASSAPHRRFRAVLFAGQTLELLKMIGFPETARFYLCGFSMGGLVAMEVAREVPHRIARLLLVAPAGLVPLSHMEKLGISALQGMRAIGIPVATIVAKLAKHREVDDSDFEPEVEDEERGKEVAAQRANVFRTDPEKYVKSWVKSVRDMKLSNGRALYQCLVDSGVEVMFLWGDRDNTIPLSEVLEELRGFFPTAPVLVVNGAGHGLLAEHGPTVAFHASTFFQGGVRGLIAPVVQQP